MKNKKIVLLIAIIALVSFISACNNEKEVFAQQDDIEFEDDHVEAEQEFNGEIRTHFIDVGQGDAILVKAIEGDDRHKMLIDAGTRSAGSQVVEYLKDLDIEKIHLAVGTHAHADHIGGLIEVFETFDVKKVIDPGVEHTTITFADYLTAIYEEEIEFIVGRAGMSVGLAEGLDFEIIHPAEPLTDNLNDESIVGQLRYNDVGFLFTGDLEAAGEEEVLTRMDDLENQILKVGHHGSATSTNQDFLAAVNPEVAVIQSGIDNSYGHPADEVIDRLAGAEVDIYRNDYQGDVVISTDGVDYWIEDNPYQPDQKEEKMTDKISINTADYEKLQEITGVGPAIAENIIDYRQTRSGFNSIEEIKNISGIGEVRFKNMKDEIKI
ncbi:MBL fold metallo-hydrolase [Natroniella sulfidigena]|uniref:MBL fold metallo-hydrolase n=1 Tax=Natroniella sulfidigena TaxID=723921 RepID=UPI00200B91CC|nr:MBL fold metallo-hydrolase [Natroniella sulfidigena]MCK8817898.1 MBL fold metallo-hydrolase [Natroniella sulfidigena]